MKAVIFAAGEGKRMRPLTLDTPKPLLTVLGKPLIQYTFEAMPDSVNEVVVVVGYKEEQLRAHLGAEYMGKRVTYVHQAQVGGTAEALRLAQNALGQGQFLTYYADDIYAKADAERLLEHQYGLLVAEVSNPKSFGVIELDADSRVIGFEEKPEDPKSNLVSAGVLLLDHTIFDYSAPPHPTTGEYYLTDLVSQLAADHAVYGVRAERWIPIGYPEDLAKAEEMLKQG